MQYGPTEEKPMKNTEQHEIDIKIPGFSRPAVESGAPSKVSRRRFVQSGLAVSGVLLTLTSRSAVGGNFTCKSPSGFLSGNVSTHGTPITCSGRSPGYWGNQPERWPSPYDPGKCQCNQPSSSKSSSSDSSSKSSNSDQSFMPACTKVSDWGEGTRFRDVFNCNGNGSIYVRYSMMQVIWLNGNQDPYQLGAHFVAAILNARLNLTPVLSASQIVNIFNEWNLSGFYEPTAGVHWYAADIVAYLQSTLS